MLLLPSMQESRTTILGNNRRRISDFCRYGDNEGLDENGKPIRKDWSNSHKSSELILWGHDPKPQPLLVNNTLNIDQGVVFGGSLTAYRYPEKQLVSVKAKQDYANVPDNPLKEWERKRLESTKYQEILRWIFCLNRTIWGNHDL